MKRIDAHMARYMAIPAEIEKLRKEKIRLKETISRRLGEKKVKKAKGKKPTPSIRDKDLPEDKSPFYNEKGKGEPK